MRQIDLIGNAHIDPVWLWQWQEGLAEIKATFRSALDRMNEFHNYIFTSACASYYMWIEESEPEMFEEIRRRVAEGRWCIVGGWMLQPDCNLPCGESFARQALIGQRYFKEKFGKIARTGYNVDSFGHNGNLPMILKNSGMDSYVFMRPSPAEKELSQSLFIWESMDGSRVKCYRVPLYYNICAAYFDTFAKIAAMDEKTDQMAFYGIGNHGGGATAELLKKMENELNSSFVYSDPDSFFSRQEETALPTLRDDLQYHAIGCYSACSDIKMTNRKAEEALLTAERYSVMSKATVKTAYPHYEFERGWKSVLFNQFHDILGGCTIREGIEDALRFQNEAIAIAERVENHALQQISWKIDTIGYKSDGAISEDDAEKLGTPIVVFNPHPYPVRSTVHIRSLYQRVTDREYTYAKDSKGNIIPLQKVRDSKTDCHRKYAALFEANVPAYGYTVYRLFRGNAQKCSNPFSRNATSISNGIIRLEFNKRTGELTAITDMNSSKNLLNAPTQTLLYDDTEHDTWAHEYRSYDKLLNTKVKGTVSVIEEGPVRCAVRTEQHFGSSTLIRDYYLTTNSKKVTVKAKLEFHEEYRILKLRFPFAMSPTHIHCQIPFGSIEREANGNEHVCGDWISISDINSGIAIATDFCHSFSAKDNAISLTVLRSCLYADHYADKNRDRFCEFTEQGTHRFSYVIAPVNSNADAEKLSEQLLVPITSVTETFHDGILPEEYSGISVSAHNIAVTAIKEQTDGDGIIIRISETDGVDTDAKLTVFGIEYGISISHNAVKTIKISGATATETDFMEWEYENRN